MALDQSTDIQSNTQLQVHISYFCRCSCTERNVAVKSAIDTVLTNASEHLNKLTYAAAYDTPAILVRHAGLVHLKN